MDDRLDLLDYVRLDDITLHEIRASLYYAKLCMHSKERVSFLFEKI